MEDFFGKPNEGIHSYRVYNIAIVDVVMTVLFSLCVSYGFNLNHANTIICFFIIGILAHRMFGVRTTVDKLLFN